MKSQFLSVSAIKGHNIARSLLTGIPRCRYQTTRANSKISYKAGNWHSSPPLRREAATIEPSFLAAAKGSGSPDNLIGCGSEPVYSAFHSTRTKRAPLQGTPMCEPPPKQRVGIFDEGCEILE